jgi:aminoglycoside 2'-N-acetyltransferase I
MMRVVERMVRGAYDLGALSASADGMAFYATRGWTLWTGAPFVRAPTGVQRTTEHGSRSSYRGRSLSTPPACSCDWRGVDVW